MFPLHLSEHIIEPHCGLAWPATPCLCLLGYLLQVSRPCRQIFSSSTVLRRDNVNPTRESNSSLEPTPHWSQMPPGIYDVSIYNLFLSPEFFHPRMVFLCVNPTLGYNPPAKLNAFEQFTPRNAAASTTNSSGTYRVVRTQMAAHGVPTGKSAEIW
jgi:hypothetical protein